MCSFVVSTQMVEEGSTLMRRMEICVAEAEKRSGKNAVSMQETFTVYLIETRWAQHAVSLFGMKGSSVG